MDIYTSRINLRRLSPYLVDAVSIAESIELDRQPVRESRIEVEMSGGVYPVAGATVVLAGETFIFAADGVQVGSVDHSSITGAVTVAGATIGSLSVRAVSKTGQPVTQEVTVEDSMPVRFYAQSGRIRMLSQGNTKIAQYKIMADPDKDIREKDIIYPVSGVYGVEKGLITFVRKILDFEGATVSTEAEVMKI